jgi:HAD superfamily hydrolase (TIGR01484 family)
MRRVNSFVAEMPEAPSKFLVSVHDPTERDVVVTELTAMVQAERLPLHIMTSHPVLIEGVPPGVSKASGLVWLTDYLGLSAADVLAIGDNDNDIPMLEWAGFSVAMAQGSAGALAAADWIAPGVDEDGAAVALERYVLA